MEMPESPESHSVLGSQANFVYPKEYLPQPDRGKEGKMKAIGIAIVACLACACDGKVIKRSVVKHKEYGLAVVDRMDPSSLAHGKQPPPPSPMHH